MTIDDRCEVMARLDVYSEWLVDDLVLFSADDRRLHVLNPTAARVWEAIESPRSIADVVVELAEEFGVSGLEIIGDVSAVIERFARENLCEFPQTGSSDPIGSSGTILREIADPKRIGTVGEALTLRALGVPIIMETDDVLLASELARVFAPLRVPPIGVPNSDEGARLQHIVITASDERWHVSRNGVHVLTVASRARAIRLAVSECNSAPLALIEDAVVFHSSAVDLGRGVVLFPGVSNAGKSTLAAELLLRGHEYVTDESAAVDVSSLTVRSFPKSICIEAGSQHLFPGEMSRRASVGLSVDDGSPWDIDPRLIGSGTLSDGGPIVGVVFPAFDACAEPSLRPVDSVEALRLLVANAFDFTSIGHVAFPALVQMARSLPCYVSTHSGGAAHLEQLEMLFAGTAEQRVRRSGS